MKAYVICVFATLGLNLFAEYSQKKDRNKICILALLCSMLVLCIIAGVRDMTVGTDVRGYVLRLANVSEKMDFLSYMLSPNSHAIFGVIVYVGYLFRNFNFLLFVIEVAVCFPIYLYSFQERKNSSLTLNLLIFVLTMYCTSYNLIRQSIAISILILAYHYYKLERQKVSFLLIVVAALIHITSLAFISVFFMHNIIKNNNKRKYFYLCCIVLIVTIGLYFSEYIIGLTSFSYYLDNTRYMREFSVGSIVKQIFWVMFAIGTFGIIKWGKGVDKNQIIDSELSIYLFAFSTLLTIMSFLIPGMGRLGLYFYDLALILSIPIFYRKIRPRWLMFIILFVFLFYLWWHMTCVADDSAGVYPYTSEILRFLN